MVSIFTFLPEYSAEKVEPETAPRVAVGAASPLWLMFGGAAMAGASYWWWANRWREAVNVEALMALAPEPVAPPVESVAVLEAVPVAEPVIEAVTLVAETTETVLDATQEIVEAAAEPVVETVVAANEDVAEAMVETVEAAEPVVEEVVEAVTEAPVEVVEAAAPVVEEAIETVQAATDDLTQLVGIGPKLAASLCELGVTKFSQIAAWTPDELASFDSLLNLKGRAERDAWIAQAKLLLPAEA
uniref:phasin PhaH n=1 Tax=uncultured Caulobacter sp. TaxID=158749 RepID=UPI0025D61CC6|nr:phasin PhaH [uncultured Caulobacter sp.]